MTNKIDFHLPGEDTNQAKVLLSLQELKKHQLNHWSLFKKNHELLKSAISKTYDYQNVSIKVINNPERIISTSAQVDSESINNRKCFLCPGNLPEEQRGILVEGEYYFLCNPFPIFDDHFTIANKNHLPQSIYSHIEELLNISKLVKNDFVVFYNGPKCGASAPDHLHFQACRKASLPLLTQLDKLSPDQTIKVGQTDINLFNSSILKFVHFSANSITEILYSWNAIYKKYLNFSGKEEEPLLNLICYYENETWSIIIFFRKTHRPDYFFREDENRLVISPATVDLAGALIVPRKNDYDKLDSQILENIYSQVLLSEKEMLKILLS